MKTKKAEITGETVVRIIIAIFAIIILLYLLVSLYGILTKQSELDQAKATLAKIVAKADGLEKEGDTTFAMIFNPKGWSLVNFPQDATDKPEVCYSKPCLCICPQSGLINPSSCQSFGVCNNELKNKLEFFDPVYTTARDYSLKEPFTLSLQMIGDKVILNNDQENFENYQKLNIFLEKSLTLTIDSTEQTKKMSEWIIYFAPPNYGSYKNTDIDKQLQDFSHQYFDALYSSDKWGARIMYPNVDRYVDHPLYILNNQVWNRLLNPDVGANEEAKMVTRELDSPAGKIVFTLMVKKPK